MRNLSSFLFFCLILLSQSCANDNSAVSEMELKVSESKVLEFNSYSDLFKRMDIPKMGQIGSSTRSLRVNNSIIENFLLETPIGNVYAESSNLEFEIDGKIFKLGTSGYSEYIISKDKYLLALELINNEANIIENLESYPEIDDNNYLIAEGVVLVYTGAPLYEKSQPSIDSKALVNNYAVTCGPWRSSSYFYIAYGCEMWSKNNGNKFPTDTQMEWIGVSILRRHKSDPVGTGMFIGIPNSLKPDYGDYDKKTFDDLKGVNVSKYRYTGNSGIVYARAMCEGEWVINSYNVWM
ncbi:MAG: hypothetical protein ACRC9Q_05915 [Bacteroidales bacterium]